MLRIPLFHYHEGNWSLDALLRGVRSAPHRYVVVCDTSAFRKERPERARQILEASVVHVAPAVVPELERLVDVRGAQELRDVLFPAGQLSERIRPVNLPESLTPIVSEYVHLLLLRKFALRMRVDDFTRRNGREPTDADIQNLQQEVASLGRRTHQIAGKFYRDGKLSTADEDTVVFAMMIALATERDTFILTDDLDLHEQFRKFTSLLRDDFASHRIADDLLANPDRYGPRTSLTQRPDLREFILPDTSTSFVVQRPPDLNYLFPEPRRTRAVTVVRVRDPGESITWIATQDLLAFLEEKGRCKRNTSRIGALNAYIQLPLTGSPTLPTGPYAVFIEDRPVYFVSDTSAAPKRDSALFVLAQADVIRSLVDFERSNERAIAKQIYESSVQLHHEGKTDVALGRLRTLLRRTSRGAGVGLPECEKVSAFGEAQTQFAVAALHEDKDPEKAAATYLSIVRAYESAREPHLMRIAANARVNRGRALARAGRPRDAICEWEAVERAYAFDARPSFAALAQLAAFNRAQAIATLDKSQLIPAHVRVLNQLGMPPANDELYAMTVLAICVHLASEKKYRDVRTWVRDMLLTARAGTTTGAKTRLVQMAAHCAALVPIAADRTFLGLFSEVEGFLAESNIPLSEYGSIARELASTLRRVPLRNFLTSHAEVPIRPCSQHRNSGRAARADLFTAHVFSLITSPNTDGFWFGRVVAAYQPTTEHADVGSVLREAQRLARLGNISDEYWMVSSMPTREASFFEAFDVTAMTPEGPRRLWPRPPSRGRAFGAI